MEYDVTKSLLKELLIMFSSRWVRRVNLHSMLFILMGERSSSSNQSIVMNVFRDIQRFFQGVGFGGQQSTHLTCLFLPLQPGSIPTTLLWVQRLKFSEKLYCKWCDLGKMPGLVFSSFICLLRGGSRGFLPVLKLYELIFTVSKGC